MSDTVAWPSPRRVLLIADGAGGAARAAIAAVDARCDAPIGLADGAAAIARGGYDAVLADLGGGDDAAIGTLLDALAGAARGVVLFGHDLIDRVHAALGDGALQLLCDASDDERAAALGLVLAEARIVAAYEEDEDARAERLRRLSEEMDRLARALSDVARGGSPARSPYRAAPASGAADVPPPAAPTIRGLIRARRLRAQYFDATLFADPAWDMLLDLAAARLEGLSVAVSSLCIASGVPATTALRWIKTLTGAGLFVRVADRHDARRVFIDLSDAAAAAMAAYFAAAVRTGALPI